MLLSNQITLMADQMLAQHPTLRLLRGARTPHLRLASSRLTSPDLASSNLISPDLAPQPLLPAPSAGVPDASRHQPASRCISSSPAPSRSSVLT